jgi:hypothetical protein
MNRADLARAWHVILFIPVYYHKVVPSGTLKCILGTIKSLNLIFLLLQLRITPIVNCLPDEALAQAGQLPNCEFINLEPLKTLNLL